MSLTLPEIHRLAGLARLRLSDAQAHDAQTRLNAFFGLVEQMQAVDTRGVEPLPHPTALTQPLALRLHPDAVLEPEPRCALLANAPAQEAGLFLVPKVIE